MNGMDLFLLWAKGNYDQWAHDYIQNNPDAKNKVVNSILNAPQNSVRQSTTRSESTEPYVPCAAGKSPPLIASRVSSRSHSPILISFDAQIKLAYANRASVLSSMTSW